MVTCKVLAHESLRALAGLVMILPYTVVSVYEEYVYHVCI